FIIEKIPRKLGEIAGYVISAIFIVDIIVTIIYTVKLDQLLGKVHNLRTDMQEYIASRKLYESKEELKKKLSGLRISGLLMEVRQIVDEKVHQSKVYNVYKPEL